MFLLQAWIKNKSFYVHRTDSANDRLPTTTGGQAAGKGRRRMARVRMAVRGWQEGAAWGKQNRQNNRTKNTEAEGENNVWIILTQIQMRACKITPGKSHSNQTPKACRQWRGGGGGYGGGHQVAVSCFPDYGECARSQPSQPWDAGSTWPHSGGPGTGDKHLHPLRVCFPALSLGHLMISRDSVKPPEGRGSWCRNRTGEVFSR